MSYSVERFGPPSVAIACICLLAFTGPVRPYPDKDTWWHLRTGELILDSGTIPDSDPFSWTAQGRPWVAHEWGSQAIFAALERVGGPAALLLLAGALVGAAVLVLQRTLRRSGAQPWARALALLASVFMTSLIWTLRPHLFSLLFLAVFFDLLTAERLRPGRRASWLLVPATVIWANLHGAFVLGPALIVVYAAVAVLERRPETRRLLLIGGLSLVAGCLTPHGPALYLYPLHVAEVSYLVNEWQPPDLREPQALVFALSVIGSLGLLALRRKAPDTAHLVAAALFALLGFAAMKNIAFSAIVLAPLVASAADGLVPGGSPSKSSERVPLMVVLGVGIVAAALLAGSFVVGKSESELLEEKSFPAAAVQALNRRPPGRLANPYDWGGYLIYRARAFPVSMDGRNDMYGRSLFERQLLLEDLKPGWDDFLTDNDVRYVLWQRKRPLAEALRLAPGWDLIHEDRLAALFERAATP
ncbi:MAG: hypothetical protein ACRDI3_06510 [Actinomycetota bacterium]